MAETGSCTESLGVTYEEKKSRGISVDAAPFTPRSKIASSVLSPLAPEFYPRNYVAVGRVNDVAKTGSAAEVPSLVKVKQIIATLVLRPEDFDQVMVPLVQSLMGSVRDEHALLSVMKELVSKSVCNANFRYIGARICWHLCQHLKFSFGSFEDHLFQRCKSDCANLFCDISKEESTKEELSQLIDFTFFLAELLFNMKDCSGSPFLREFPNKIAELILKLVKVGTSEALQGSVKILKLVGAVLERRGVDLDSIFSELKDSSDQNSDLTRLMISNLIAQRADNWGLGDGEVIVSVGAGDSTNSMCADASIQPKDGGSVAYETNNQVYGIPEAADGFASLSGWNASGTNNIHTDNNVQYWVGNQAMDPETVTAFEEFVTESEPNPVKNFWRYQP